MAPHKDGLNPVPFGELPMRINKVEYSFTIKSNTRSMRLVGGTGFRPGHNQSLLPKNLWSAAVDGRDCRTTE